MKDDDPRLSDMLKQWREIEPSANFEASVRRRLRLAEAGMPERVSVLELRLRGLIWRPALAVAAVLVVSVLIGSAAGVVTARKPVSVTSGELGFMAAGTLAGGYVQLASHPAAPQAAGGR